MRVSSHSCLSRVCHARTSRLRRFQHALMQARPAPVVHPHLLMPHPGAPQRRLAPPARAAAPACGAPAPAVRPGCSTCSAPGGTSRAHDCGLRYAQQNTFVGVGGNSLGTRAADRIPPARPCGDVSARRARWWSRTWYSTRSADTFVSCSEMLLMTLDNCVRGVVGDAPQWSSRPILPSARPDDAKAEARWPREERPGSITPVATTAHTTRRQAPVGRWCCLRTRQAPCPRRVTACLAIAATA